MRARGPCLLASGVAALVYSSSAHTQDSGAISTFAGSKHPIFCMQQGPHLCLSLPALPCVLRRASAAAPGPQAVTGSAPHTRPHLQQQDNMQTVGSLASSTTSSSMPRPGSRSPTHRRTAPCCLACRPGRNVHCPCHPLRHQEQQIHAQALNASAAAMLGLLRGLWWQQHATQRTHRGIHLLLLRPHLPAAPCPPAVPAAQPSGRACAAGAGAPSRSGAHTWEHTHTYARRRGETSA